MIPSDISQIPFNKTLVEHFVAGFNGNFDILRRLGVRVMSDVLSVTRGNFLMSVGGTERRWQKVEELKRVLSLNKKEVEEYFMYCVQCHEFPILSPAQQNLSLNERAELAIEQVSDFLREASIYDSSYARAYMKVESFILKDEDKNTAMKRFSLSSGERVRQLRTEFFASLREGNIVGLDNIRFDDDFIMEIKQIAESLPMYVSRAVLCDAFSVADIETSWVKHFIDYKEVYGEDNAQYSYFDQPYYIPTLQYGEDVKKYITGVIAVLGRSKDADIRPLTLEQVMDTLEQNNPDYDYDQETVDAVLKQHSWVECVMVDGRDAYQLNYELLNDYQKLGRIIYEKERITIDEIKEELERRGSNRASAIIKSLRMTSVKYNWVCLAGQNGVYEYNPEGQNRMSLNEAVRKFAEERICFTWDEIYAYLSEAGYEKLVESSIRTYITSICTPSKSNANLFCLQNRIDDYPQISWKSKKQQGLCNWLLPIVIQYLKTKGGKADRKAIIDVLLAKNSQGFKLKNDITTYLYPYAKDASGYFSISGGTISLTPRAWNLTQDEIEKVGLRNRTPDYYMTTVSYIKSILQQTEGGEAQMSVIRDKCRELVSNLTDAAFYKIVDKFLPEQITKYERDGRAYLKLVTEKIDYAPAYEVDAVSSVRESAPKLVPSNAAREESLPGNRNVFSWEHIRRKMISDLAFYDRQWDLDLTLEQSIDKFIAFMQSQKGSARLSVFVPQAMYEFWHCKNDNLDYYRYMMEIATSYEQVLAAICKENGVAVYANGLKDIIDSIPEMRDWLYCSPSDGFKKIFGKLKYTRNLLAHGKDVDDTLFLLIQRTIEFIALYIYTVARFLE